MEFCPGCGKKSKVICKDCRPRKEIKVKDIHIMLCSSCKKYFHNNKWTSYSKLKDAITKITKDSIKEIGSFAITPVLDEIQINPGIKEEFDIEIKSDDEIFLIPAELEVTYCNHCSKQQGDYFEGTLQLRKVPDELLEYVYSYIKKK